jgi:hypothetical protein
MHIEEVSDPFTTYLSSKRRVFRTISIEQMPNTEKWVKSSKKSLYRVLIIYKDNDELNWLEFDYDNILKKVCRFKR